MVRRRRYSFTGDRRHLHCSSAILSCFPSFTSPSTSSPLFRIDVRFNRTHFYSITRQHIGWQLVRAGQSFSLRLVFSVYSGISALRVEGTLEYGHITVLSWVHPIVSSLSFSLQGLCSTPLKHVLVVQFTSVHLTQHVHQIALFLKLG